MKRHVFLIPGFFGFANLGDFTYWGHVSDKLGELLDKAGMPAAIHSVKSLPTASLRVRTLRLLQAIAAARPGSDAVIHLVGHSTGGLDARLLLTRGVDLETAIDAERYARLVRSSISVSTPHLGAPIASFFTGLMGPRLLQLLSLLTMAGLRGTRLPLSVWARMAGLFAIPFSLAGASDTLAKQLYGKLLSEFDAESRTQLSELLAEVEQDQSLLMQLTMESLDVFNAAAGDRDGVLYGSVVTWARPPSLATSLEIGFDPVEQAEQVFYYSLSSLATGYDFPGPAAPYKRALKNLFGELPDSDANDGVVPTLSQPWGRCIAVAQADHLDIIGHFHEETDDSDHYDWLTTHSDFGAAGFHDVWQRVVDFMAEAEGAGAGA